MDIRTQRQVDNYVGRLGIAALRPATMLLGRILRRDHRLSVGDELVWVKLLGGGSLLLAMPTLIGLRKQHPNVRMVLITTPSVKPFADLVGVFDSYRIIDNRGLWSLLTTGVSALVKTLRADCIIDLEVHSRLTTVFTTLTMARNRVSFWLEDIFWRRGLSSHLIFFNKASPTYHFYDRLADLFGAPAADRDTCRSRVLASCGLPDAVTPTPGTVAVGFACSDLSRERMLTPAQWVEVFRTNLRPQHQRFVLLGARVDRPAGDAIIASVRSEFPQLTLENRCGELTLKQSVAAITQAEAFWGIDSSLLHIARLIGLRCTSYWGPTNPSFLLRETWTVDEVVHYRKVACSPCVHTSEEPPCHGDNRCIQSLFQLSPSPAAPDNWTPIEHPPERARRPA